MFSFINIIGYGYVGSSMGFLCKKRNIKYSITDTLPKEDQDSVCFFNVLENTIKYSEEHNKINFYFICVPTPSKKESYECDTSIVSNIFNILSKNCNKTSIVIIKSTVAPGTSRKLYDENTNNSVSLFFNPEFLTEKNAENDILNEKKIIIGCDSKYKNVYITSLMSKLYNTHTGINFCLYEHAEMMKYTINTYLAQKVSFFNQIYEICEKLNISYDDVKDLFLLDERISPSHTSVPGPDDKFGFGGSCFVKELKCIADLAEKLNVQNYFKQVLNYNNIVRLKNSKDLRNNFIKYVLEDYSSIMIVKGLDLFTTKGKNPEVFPQDRISLEFCDIGNCYLNLEKEQLVSIEIENIKYFYSSQSVTTVYFKDLIGNELVLEKKISEKFNDNICSNGTPDKENFLIFFNELNL